ncbi:TetR/AcrR family transcriptional regulator [Pseudonocardia benzenivorans]|uniref:Regulatory protein TetR n=2 Tax=Pseudonocardia TaxID=1847 RepID=F4CJE4_PSEUX|nr:TetR/AcrR family transcriptional regulator [Pseudonocardia dioxanivorans]AEA24896.1 regulatory protein TetR [Pseudonocardia dioxanivorans CB1190]GJF02656.1 TetR family transcriptional regulator [Pseudonocardia sp. D17]
MDLAEASDRLLVAAERLYYSRGIAAVGIDDVRAEAGVSMRRLYQLFPSKEHLVAAYLDARDVRWRGRVAAHVDAAGDDPGDRLLAVFDWLGLWFAEDDFRGCAFINAFGEIGGESPLILAAVQRHKDLFRDYLADLARAFPTDSPDVLASAITLLAEGAMTVAAIGTDPAAAEHAKLAARTLLDAARRRS